MAIPTDKRDVPTALRAIHTEHMNPPIDNMNFPKLYRRVHMSRRKVPALLKD
jgi:hypothetical protein